MKRKAFDPWEYVSPVVKLGTKFVLGGRPGVRRMAVPGGWLYQVQHWDCFSDSDGVVGYDWHAPVFVPKAS